MCTWRRPRVRRCVLAAAVVLAAFTATPIAYGAAPRTATLHTSDGQWKVEVTAFKNYLVVYSSIGTEVTAYHWERERRWYDPWYNHHHWVKRPVDRISITNRYSGLLPSMHPSAAVRTASASRTSHLEDKLWAVGIGVSMDASAGSGLPDPGTAGPCCGAKLDVREVEGTAHVRIGDEVLTAVVGAR